VETIEELRARLRQMADEELRAYVVVAKIMCSGSVKTDKPPRECFQRQLSEARADWNQRHPESEVIWQLGGTYDWDSGRPCLAR
jgi:hypothetical protein